MSGEIIPVLFFGLHDAYERLRARLTGLTPGEYLWEPVPDAWTNPIRPGDDDRLAAVAHRELPRELRGAAPGRVAPRACRG